MAEIKYYGDANPTFTHVVDGLQYQFSLSAVDPEAREWLVEVVSRYMDTIANQAKLSTLEKTRRQIKDALGLT